MTTLQDEKCIGAETSNKLPEVARMVIPLSPIERYDDLDDDYKKDYLVYKEHLTQALENERIHNIAVSGNFGVGKSSILRVFEGEQSKNSRWLHVSIGSFRKKSTEDKEKETVQLEERFRQQQDIEVDLLRQITAECNRNDIPNTSFELVPVQENGFRKFKKGSTAFVVFVLTILLFLFFSENIAGLIKDVLYFIIAGGVAVILGLLAYFLLPKLQISQIVVKSDHSEIIAACKGTGSYLEQNCFELVYVLESLTHRKEECTVVFEDMDRLDENICVDLFEKLREINYLVNRRLQGKGKLVFIYVVNDELISHISMEKFFDYIIPIIPIVSRRNLACQVNSYKLFEILKKEFTIEDEPKVKEMIGIIGAGVSDFRTIYTVINEYRVFSKIVNNHQNGNYQPSQELDPCLFAFLIYKNARPAEYYKICKDGKLPDKWLQGIPDDQSYLHELLMSGFLSKNCIRYVGC